MLRKIDDNQSRDSRAQIHSISTTIDLSTITNSYNRFCSIELHKKNSYQALEKAIKSQYIIFLR